MGLLSGKYTLESCHAQTAKLRDRVAAAKGDKEAQARSRERDNKQLVVSSFMFAGGMIGLIAGPLGAGIGSAVGAVVGGVLIGSGDGGKEGIALGEAIGKAKGLND